MCYYLDRVGAECGIAPRTEAGFFCGWQLESGMRYRGILKIGDYDKVKEGNFPRDLL
jgi:hypothetical protein